MTTQWGGCPEKNPLPHSRFDPGLLIRDPISLGNLIVKQVSAIARQHMPHNPLSGQHEKFGNLGNRPAGQGPWWGLPVFLRHHHLDHTTSTSDQEFTQFYHVPTSPARCGTQSSMPDMLGKDYILSGTSSSAPKAEGQSSRTPRIVGTGGLRVHHLTPPHFAGLSFRYGDCSLRTHNRHAVSVVTWKPHLAVIEMNDRWDGFIFFPSYCSPSLPFISFSLLLFCYIQTEASAYITGKDRKAQLWERGFPDRPAGYPWTPIHH